jgi:hypothetical protein
MKHLSNMSWIGVAAIFIAHTALTYIGLWVFVLLADLVLLLLLAVQLLLADNYKWGLTVRN